MTPPTVDTRKARKLKDKANALLAKGKDKKALSLYTEVLKEQPKDVAAMMKVGDLGRRLGMNELALSVYGRAAEAYALDGLLLRGIAVCKIILEFEPGHRSSQERLAELYTRQYGYVPRDQALGEVSGAVASKELGVHIEIDLDADLGAETEAPLGAPAGGNEPTMELETSALELLGTDEIDLIDEDADDIEIEEEELMIDLPALEPGDVTQLPRIPLLSDLPAQSFVSLVNRVPLRRYAQGDFVVREGDDGDSFFIILSGAVDVLKSDIEIACLEEGAFFGEMALIAPGTRQASVRASEDLELLEISNGELDALAAEHPQVVDVLAAFTGERLLNNLTLTSPLFAPFAEGDRQSLMARFTAVQCDAGEVIVRQGDAAGGLCVVAIGEMDVFHTAEDGAETHLAELTAGAIFGEMSVLTHAPAVATVRATVEGRLLVLSRAVFTEVMMTHPQVLELISMLSDARQRENAELLKPALASDREGGCALL